LLPLSSALRAGQDDVPQNMSVFTTLEVLRMHRLTMGISSFFLFAGVLAAAENPEIKALHKQIEVLRAQEKATVQAVRTRYETAIKGERLSEEVLARERKALAQQESDLLSVASTQEDKDVIRNRYETLRSALFNGIKIDSKQIAALRAEENALSKVISASYRAKIRELEAAIKVLEKAPKPKSGKK
jgi:uncharacterized protein involved in exopolysaccharide biosynthesis